MTTITQRFFLYISDKEDLIALEDNLSYLPKEDMKTKFANYIKQFTLNPAGRYVAVGDAGDSIVYENGDLFYTSDSH